MDVNILTDIKYSISREILEGTPDHWGRFRTLPAPHDVANTI